MNNQERDIIEEVAEDLAKLKRIVETFSDNMELQKAAFEPDENKSSIDMMLYKAKAEDAEVLNIIEDYLCIINEKLKKLDL